MKIRVITPTLDKSRWLGATIESVAARVSVCEHVLVAPAERVAALTALHPGVTVVPESGGGMYAAINTGLAVPGQWDAFTYLNDDDVLLPGFDAAVRTAGSAGRNCFVYGKVRLIDGAGDRLGAIPVSRFPAHNRALYAQRLEPVYQHGTLVGRSVWETHGGFDPAFLYCGDSEFLARLGALGVSPTYVNAEVAAFRLRRGQLTKNRSAMLEERKRVDEKLHLLPAKITARHRWARLVFRVSNLPVYAERIVRHGFISFDELLERGA